MSAGPLQCAPTRRLRASLASVVLAAVLCAIGWGAAVAAEQLPVIVGYEAAKHREVARELRNDPKTFWIGQVLARIEERRIAPLHKVSGMVTVHVSFKVARDGRLLTSAVSRSSGRPDLDRAADEMVKRAAPFPPMPQTLSDDDVAFVLPVRFR